MAGPDFHVAARRNHFDPSCKIEKAKVSVCTKNDQRVTQNSEGQVFNID